jgi:hypothetical protein
MPAGRVVRKDGAMFGVDALLLTVLGIGALVLKVWALADAIYRPGQAYVAAGKLTKLAWIAILAVALLLTGSSFMNLFGLIAVIAAIVYLVDVRPAVREVSSGGPWA